ncbi:hypothetical protein ACOMHN_044020 [Nucella lapillus]
MKGVGGGRKEDIYSPLCVPTTTTELAIRQMNGTLVEGIVCFVSTMRERKGREMRLIYVLILVSVGLVFNSLCFVTFVFTSLRTTSTCVYMAAIAVLDSIVLVHALCVLLSRSLGQAVFYMHTDWTCGFHFFLFYFTIPLDVLVLLVMTVDRFIVVKFLLKAQSWCTPKSAIRVITELGIFSFALNFQFFLTGVWST